MGAVYMPPSGGLSSSGETQPFQVTITQCHI
jgi:hypothetical protein